MQDFMEFLRTRRTYRRFQQKAVPAAMVDDILEAARIASCGANRQTLIDLVAQSPEQVDKVNGLVHWAAYLPPEQGIPKAEERPTLFIAVFQDEALPGANDTDAGLALGSMTAAAAERGAAFSLGAAGRFCRPAATPRADSSVAPPVAMRALPSSSRRLVPAHTSLKMPPGTAYTGRP